MHGGVRASKKIGGPSALGPATTAHPPTGLTRNPADTDVYTLYTIQALATGRLAPPLPLRQYLLGFGFGFKSKGLPLPVCVCVFDDLEFGTASAHLNKCDT
jgi:hypothetical protein